MKAISSLFGFVSPSSESKDNRSNKIGVKDIKIIEVVKRVQESTSNECSITFLDGRRVSCVLTNTEIADLWNNTQFVGALKGMSTEEEWFDPDYGLAPGDISPSMFTDLDEQWVNDLYEKKDNSTPKKDHFEDK